MRVVTARVHRPVARRPVESGVFGNRESVHVGSHQDGGNLRRVRAIDPAAAHHGGYRRHRGAERQFDSRFDESVQQVGLGQREVEAHFGHGVQIATYRDDVDAHRVLQMSLVTLNSCPSASSRANE